MTKFLICLFLPKAALPFIKFTPELLAQTWLPIKLRKTEMKSLLLPAGVQTWAAQLLLLQPPQKVHAISLKQTLC